MATILLGAGFPANWGGYVASEFWDLLYSQPAINGDPTLKGLLDKDPSFEGVFTEVRLNHPAPLLRTLQDGILRAFRLHDETLRQGLRLGTRDLPGLWEFLNGMDFVFTLNQDLSFERLRLRHDPITPGIDQIPWSANRDFERTDPYEREIDEVSAANRVCAGTNREGQKLVKLHGSINWRIQGDNRLLIIGGNKSEDLDASPLLREYRPLFVDSLAHERLLFVIGYGFRDTHINGAIAEALGKGLQGVYIFDPSSPKCLRRNMRKFKGDALWSAVCGYQRRPITRLFRSSEGRTPFWEELQCQFSLDS